MAVAILRPNADTLLEWSITDGGATEAWQVLDDAVEQPTAPTTASDFISTTGLNAITETATTTVSVGSVSEAKLWAYASTGTNGTTNCELLIVLAKPAGIASFRIVDNSAAAWYSATFTGSLTQAEVDDLRCHFVSEGGAGGARTVYAAYVELTYTESAGTKNLLLLGVG